MQYKTKKDETVELSDRASMLVPTGTVLTFVDMKPIIVSDGKLQASRMMAMCSVTGWPANLIVAFDPSTLELLP